MKILGLYSEMDLMDIRVKEKLWDTVIRSGLEYATEIWDAGEWKEAEKIQREIGQQPRNL